MTSKAFTCAFVAEIERRAGALGLSQSSLARAAFSGVADPVGRWRKIRRQGQKTTLADAWELARAVQVDVETVVRVAKLEATCRA
ncbi:MAG: hypothetical protein AB1921_14315 [Thermodesulfobacteriota bacterium]